MRMHSGDTRAHTHRLCMRVVFACVVVACTRNSIVTGSHAQNVNDGKKHALSGLRDEDHDRLHYGLWIGLGGSLSILVKIFISVILLKLYKIVKVTYEHTLPAHTADF